MFYKALGFVVWKLGTSYVRRRLGRQLRVAALMGAVGIVAAAYLASRSGD